MLWNRADGDGVDIENMSGSLGSGCKLLAGVSLSTAESLLAADLVDALVADDIEAFLQAYDAATTSGDIEPNRLEEIKELVRERVFERMQEIAEAEQTHAEATARKADAAELEQNVAEVQRRLRAGYDVADTADAGHVADGGNGGEGCPSNGNDDPDDGRGARGCGGNATGVPAPASHPAAEPDAGGRDHLPCLHQAQAVVQAVGAVVNSGGAPNARFGPTSGPQLTGGGRHQE